MSLSVVQADQLFLYVALLATFVFLIKCFIPIDFGAETGGDFQVMVENDSSFHLFSIEGISAFFMCSGWMGWLSLAKVNLGLKISIIVAIISGILGMFLFAWLIAQFKKLEHDPKPSLDELKDRTGKAYLQFAPLGNGKIQIEFNSKLATLDAKNNSDEEIKAFEDIKVVKIENNIIYIEKLK